MMGLRQRAREHRAPLRNGVTARGYPNEAPARDARRARPARARAARWKAPARGARPALDDNHAATPGAPPRRWHAPCY